MQTVTYRRYLEREYQSRTRRNPQYSLRAYARDLGMQPSKLSELLRSLCGLSESTAVEVSKKLRLGENEAMHFRLLVESEHARSETRRTSAAEKLKSFERNFGYLQMDLEKFLIISDWYHFALLELTDVTDFNSAPDWISRRLGISLEEATKAIDRLVSFGLLTQDEKGRLHQTYADIATSTGIPSSEIREHHRQTLEKAAQSIEINSVHERELKSSTMAIQVTDLPKAKAMIQEFSRNFAHEMQKAETKDRVYCLSIQYFPLDQNNAGESL